MLAKVHFVIQNYLKSSCEESYELISAHYHLIWLFIALTYLYCYLLSILSVLFFPRPISPFIKIILNSTSASCVLEIPPSLVYPANFIGILNISLTGLLTKSLNKSGLERCSFYTALFCLQYGTTGLITSHSAVISFISIFRCLWNNICLIRFISVNMLPMGLSSLPDGREPESVLSTSTQWSTLLFNLTSGSGITAVIKVNF